MSDTRASNNKPSRRRVLRGAAALTGAAIGSSAIRGFPTLWAQNIKDVTLIMMAVPQVAIPQIAAKASKDLGFKIVMQVVDQQTQLQRTVTAPTSFDIVNNDNSTFKYVEHSGVFKPIPVKNYKWWDETLSMFTTGKLANGEMVSEQGLSPIATGFWSGPDAKSFAGPPRIGHPTEWLTMVPILFNADTLGTRPDLVGGEKAITSWAQLLDTKYKGKTALCDLAVVGIMDTAMALQSSGAVKYGDKGNMTRAEIDETVDTMMKLKKAGQFRAFWTNFNESVNLMAAGEVVLQSMWSPAVTADSDEAGRVFRLKAATHSDLKAATIPI